MENHFVTILIRLLLALAAGGVIGLERTLHGRPAGFRTHTLVCTASALLMILTGYGPLPFPRVTGVTVAIDPLRMAQGIMTGIGFLGAGVIIKEKLAIRGLTTAASIWLTAAIGIGVGIGFYPAALVATLLALGTLALFRWIEMVLPNLHYSQLEVSFHRQDLIPEEELVRIIKTHRLTSLSHGYHLRDDGKILTYHMTLRTRDQQNFGALAAELSRMKKVCSFNLLLVSS